MSKRGFSLLEVMLAVAILSVIMMALYGMSRGLNQVSQTQEAVNTGQDDVRLAMQQITRELRQAAMSSINWGNLPGSSISYRIATDLDGNGLAVDENGRLELSPARTIGRDTDDANGDGITQDQLLLTISEADQRVLANALRPDEAGGADVDGSGEVDRGVWFERWGQGIRVSVQTQHPADPDGTPVTVVISELVMPRN